MELCDDLGFSNVTFKGHAKSVIQATNSVDENWLWYGQLIEDTRRMQLRRPLWKVQFVFREANCVAHNLAKLALAYDVECVWMEEGPYVIDKYVLLEKSYLRHQMKVKNFLNLGGH